MNTVLSQPVLTVPGLHSKPVLERKRLEELVNEVSLYLIARVSSILIRQGRTSLAEAILGMSKLIPNELLVQFRDISVGNARLIAQSISKTTLALCRTGEFAMHLRSAWLGNEILSLSPRFMAHQAREPHVIDLEGGFGTNLKETRKLIMGFQDDHCASRVLDRGPLESATQELRSITREVYHDAYLEHTDFAELHGELQRSFRTFKRQSEVVRRVFRDPGCDASERTRVFTSFKSGAAELAETLNRIPPHVVLF